MDSTSRLIVVDSARVHYPSDWVCPAKGVLSMPYILLTVHYGWMVVKFFLARVDFRSQDILAPFRVRTVLYRHELYAHFSGVVFNVFDMDQIVSYLPP